MTDDDRPLLAGVCGQPIGHSKSPVLFEHWFSTLGVPGRYVPLLIRPEDLAEVLPALGKAGFRGVNVTIPHKLSALNLADEATDAARRIGAANTLVFRRDGTILADNTDGFGFLANLRASAGDWDPASGPAAMLGAGGAARAAIHALLSAGVPEVRVSNRTAERAQELAAHFGPRVVPVAWDARGAALADARLLVNTTSLGMTGKAPLEMPLDAAQPGLLVNDIVYSPLETPLLSDARARGLRVVDGLGMLLHQARPGFRHWFGIDPPVTPALRAACLGVAA